MNKIKFIWLWKTICNVNNTLPDNLKQVYSDRSCVIRNRYYNTNHIYIGLACLARLVIRNQYRVLWIFIDSNSMAILHVKTNWTIAHVNINNNSNCIIKLMPIEQVRFKFVVGKESRIKLLIANTLSSSEVLITIVLLSHSRVLISSNSLNANHLNKQVFYNTILKSYVNVKIVYNTLILNESYVAVRPVFNIKYSNAVCVHSVTINGGTYIDYLNNRIAKYAHLAALTAFNKCIVQSN